MSGRRILTVLLCLALLAASCGGGETTTTLPAPADTAPVPPTDDSTAGATTVPPETPDSSPTSEATTTTTQPAEPLEEGVERVDYLTFAQGAVPLSFAIEGPGSGADSGSVMQVIDGNPTPRIQVSQATADTVVEMVFELPAPTTFDRFAIPKIAEVPSASTTFFRSVEVLGATDPGGPFVTLAAADLETHTSGDQVTELDIAVTTPVRFVKVRMGGGIHIELAESNLELSELIGNGTQDTVDLVEGFTGIWDALLPDIDRSIGFIELTQDGAVVTGCFENVDLTGTVTGNIARFGGVDRSSGVVSAYIFSLTADGALQGVASTNGGPFGFTRSVIAPEGTVTGCSDIPQPDYPLACGSIIHGINFDFNSANLRPESDSILQQLFEGLQADGAASIVVEGHTSTEGSDTYNADLSNRRAQAVVDDLVRRGIDPSRISALGKGEAEPLIKPDNDEASRSMNRRVEIDCG